MNLLAQQAGRRFRWLNRLRRNRRGSVAIEFAALIIPFALLIFAILESTISFAAQQLMATVTDDVARQLRTGQIHRNIGENELRNMICSRMEIIVSSGCPGLEIDLRSYDTFAAAAAQQIRLTNDRDIDTDGFAVNPGGPLTKNMLRVFYRWPVMTDFMRRAMSNLKDGKTLHFVAVTWQNEPFEQ